MTQTQLNEVITLHRKWLNKEPGGVQASLSDANLSDANLRSANLRSANLRSADLSDANLSDANLSDASLIGANLIGANLIGASLIGASLIGANLRDADLRGADLRGANLRDADLKGADLTDAGLKGANLKGANGNLLHIKSIQTEKYCIAYTFSTLQIGCQRHSIEEWQEFSDETIARMDKGALKWWVKWRPIIMQIIEMAPCEPTKG